MFVQLLVACLVATLALSANAQTTPVPDNPLPAAIDVTELGRMAEINARVVWLTSPVAMTPGDANQRFMEGAFRRVTTLEPDFGYINQDIWLAASVRNTTDQPLQRYLMMHTNFMTEIDVHLLTSTHDQLLLSQNEASVFSSRPVPYHELVAPFTLQPGEEATLLIRYASNGDTVLPLSMVDDVGLAIATNKRLVIDFSFYGIMLMFILASIFGRIFFPNPTFVAYACYATGVLLLIFQRDGYAFQFLWPNAPRWNDFSSLPLGAALPLLAAVFARTYLNTRALHPHIDKVLVGIVAVHVLLVAASAVIGASLAKQIALITVSISIAIFLSIGVMAYQRYGRRTLFFLIGWLGLLAGTLVMTTVHWFEIDITRAQSLNVMRTSMVFDALMMGFAAVFLVVDLQRDRDKLSQDKIEILATNLQLHERYARLEQNYEMASALAKSSSETLADVTHDLRQPLFALRAAISDLASDKGADLDLDDVEKSFTYIETLVEGALQAAVDQEGNQETRQKDAQEECDLSDILGALETMFQADAAAQNIDLRTVASTAKAAVPSFAVLRILSNVLANAIQYSPGARVLVGARHRSDKLLLQVHDTGPGLSETQISEITRRSVRGDTSQGTAGHGMGLSIVDKLASENGLAWSLESQPGVGTLVTLELPKIP